MFDTFATRALHSHDSSIFRPVWQVESQPFRSHGDYGADGGDFEDSEEEAATYFRAQLDDSYGKGFADGQAALAQANAQLITASEKLADAAQNLKAQPGDALCETLVRSIRTLLERTAGFSAPDADTLRQHCAALARLAEKDCSHAVLHIHPADRLLLGTDDLGLTMEEDTSLTRGTLCLAHADGWIEQGTQPVLDELEAMLASLASARSS